MLIEKKEKGYYIIVNCEELLRVAEAKGHKNVILCTEDCLPLEDLKAIKDSGKSVLIYAFYDEKYKYSDLSELKARLSELDVRVMYWGPIGETMDEFVALFPDVRRVEQDLISRGEMLDTDYTNRCGNCHAHMDEKDKFCKFCGTRKGEGKFLPYENEAYAVYGPPVKIKYTCKSCGHSWMYGGLGSLRESKYCPMCRTQKIQMNESWDKFI